MRELVASFPNQLEKALEIAKVVDLDPFLGQISNVLITGLGGSGIAGTIVSEISYGVSNVPVFVNKTYSIPKWVGKETLVLVSSYSGNTEETLEALNQAIEAGAEIACITSGGEVEKLAKDNGFNFILLPGGNPPRTMIAYSFVQQLRLFHHYSLLKLDYRSEINAAIELIRNETESITDIARQAAEKMNGKFPAIYACAGYEGVAVRLRQQLNENAKILCWHHVIPEMNHNELVGWQEDEFPQVLPVFLTNEDDYQRNQTRVEINKELIGPKVSEILEIKSKGNTRLIRILYLIHLSDWISVKLGELRKVDLVDIKSIDHLKGKLSEL